MSVPVIAVLVFVAWGLVLVAAIEVWRMALMAGGGYRADQFPAGVQHGPGSYWRLNRAHLNVLEFLPFFAATVFAAEAGGYRSELFATLSAAIVAARLVQSFIHIASGAAAAIQLRALAFLTQLACLGWMVVLLLQPLAISAIRDRQEIVESGSCTGARIPLEGTMAYLE